MFQFVKVSKELTDVKFVKVNGDDFEDLIEKYEVSGQTTCAVLKDGELVESKSGKMDEETLKKFIKEKM